MHQHSSNRVGAARAQRMQTIKDHQCPIFFQHFQQHHLAIFSEISQCFLRPRKFFISEISFYYGLAWHFSSSSKKCPSFLENKRCQGIISYQHGVEWEFVRLHSVRKIWSIFLCSSLPNDFCCQLWASFYQLLLYTFRIILQNITIFYQFYEY